jgi:hypothetical protein
VGETDWITKENPQSKLVETQLVTTQVLNYQIRSGLSIFAGYDFWDPNIDKKEDNSVLTNDFISTRYKLGLNFFPTSYYGLSPVVYFQEENNIKTRTGELMFRVWF